MIRIKCASCARALGLEDSLVGRPAFCPACGFVFTVPAPAVLLDGVSASPPLAGPPPDVDGGADPPANDEPLLPEGPIALAGEIAAPVLSIEKATPDPWLLSPGPLVETATPASAAGARPVTARPEPSPTPSADGLDWAFLALEPVPEQRLELSIEEELASAGMPIETSPAPVAEPADVAWATPTALAEAPIDTPVPEAIPFALAPSLDIPEAIPVSAEEAEQLLKPGPAPQAVPAAAPAAVVWAEPVVESPALTAEVLPEPVVEWDDAPRLDEPLPPAPRKKKSTWGPVSLIEGLEDFHLGMIALGSAWLLLTVTVLIWPKVFWLPLVVGGVIWLCGNFWFGLGLEDAGRIVQGVIAVLPLGGIPMYFFYGSNAVLIYQLAVMSFMMALAVPYVIVDLRRMLRPYLVALMGALLVIMGLVALRWTQQETHDLVPPPPPPIVVPDAP